MAAFYARYTPPSKSSGASKVLDNSTNGTKRKYDSIDEPSRVSEKRRRHGAEASKDANPPKASKEYALSLDAASGRILTGSTISNEKSHKKRSKGSKDGAEIIAKYSIGKSVRNRQSGEDVSENASSNDKAALPLEQLPKDLKRKTRQMDQEGKKPVRNPDLDTDILQDVEDTRHARVLTKFAQSKRLNAAATTSAASDDKPALPSGNKAGEDHESELRGLVPLPQPAEVEDEVAFPAYSILPTWMARPLRVSSAESSTFASMNLDNTLLANLQGKGIEQAFPVQASVIPLLKTGAQQHGGDVCISAATGSGKTLAYIVPMVEALKSLAGTELRGLIVVPTRELVNQAREVCETCAAGSSLKIATALGSKPLREEQATLLETRHVYDPERYQEEQEQPIDWTRFSLEDLISESGNVSTKRNAFNYVEEHRSQVDILICTPGRLVDHLRATTGFNLDHVRWLVVDEADRLLNESFQEWVDVVMPALRSTEAMKKRDNILRGMRMEVPERIIRKVICSATLTQDVSKLNLLELRNPKLVVVGNQATVGANADGEPEVDDEEPTPDIHGTFNIPMTLSEAAISVGDGSEKPLYLLKLLRSCVAAPNDKLVTADSEDNVSGPPANGTLADSDDDSSQTSDDEGSTSQDDSDSAPATPTRTIEQSKSGAKAPLNAFPSTLIFTRSTESATRLSRLLSLLAPNLSPQIGTLTKSSNSSATSRKTLSQLNSGKLRIIIATDRASRGLDVPNLQHVVSYDVPTSSTTYVHRVGRTARAGKSGHAWTLVAHREGRWFWKEIGGKGNSAEEGRIARSGKVKRLNLELKDELMKGRYEDALKQLGEEVRGSD